MAGRFPFPIPNGWFAVARSDELEPGQVRPVHYFGRDLAVFRTMSGEARVLDAYCVHLGANMAVGGTVAGECLECPFHAWRFDGETGACVEVPYSDAKISPKATVDAYPVVERFGLVFAWHHLGGAAPFIEMPVVEEFDDPEWTEPDVREFEIATCCQEMAENNADYVHFRYVHGFDDIPAAEVDYDGFVKIVTERQQFKAGESVHTVDFVRRSYGLGLGALRLKGVMSFVSSVSPIDEEHVRVRWVFTMPRSMAAQIGDKMITAFLDGVQQDIPIWENKRYVQKPLLIRGDGPIVEFRHWAKQFYGESVPTEPFQPRARQLEAVNG